MGAFKHLPADVVQFFQRNNAIIFIKLFIFSENFHKNLMRFDFQPNELTFLVNFEYIQSFVTIEGFITCVLISRSIVIKCPWIFGDCIRHRFRLLSLFMSFFSPFVLVPLSGQLFLRRFYLLLYGFIMSERSVL